MMRNETNSQTNEERGGEGFHQRLRRLRERKDLSARKVARLLGVAESTYRDWEYGHSIQNLNMLPKICTVLGVSLSELVVAEVEGRQAELARALDEAETLIQRSRQLLHSFV